LRVPALDPLTSTSLLDVATSDLVIRVEIGFHPLSLNGFAIRAVETTVDASYDLG